SPGAPAARPRGDRRQTAGRSPGALSAGAGPVRETAPHRAGGERFRSDRIVVAPGRRLGLQGERTVLLRPAGLRARGGARTRGATNQDAVEVVEGLRSR